MLTPILNYNTFLSWFDRSPSIYGIFCGNTDYALELKTEHDMWQQKSNKKLNSKTIAHHCRVVDQFVNSQTYQVVLELRFRFYFERYFIQSTVFIHHHQKSQLEN